jgi:DNA-binding NarL/FixJ family response regulator
VLDLLAALVGKSLVQAEVIGGSTRYRLLETVRHYAAERLALRAGPDLKDTPVAHRDHYLSLVETAAAQLRGPDERRWLDRIEADFDNIRAALAFSIADPGSAEPGLRLAAGLKWFCYMRGRSGEIIEALGALLARPDAREPTRDRALALATSCHLLNNFGPSPAIPAMAEEAITIGRGLGDDFVAGDAMCALCWYTFLSGDLPAALALIEEAVTLARSSGNPNLLTAALGHRAAFKGEAGDLAAAAADQQEVLALARTAGDNYVLALTLMNLGVDQITAGDLRAGMTYLQESLRVADAHGYQHVASVAMANLGFTHLMGEDAATARSLFISVLDRARATGEKTLVHVAILGLALAASTAGDPAVAATLHGAADYLYEQAGQAYDALELRLRTTGHTRLLDLLGQAAFEAACQCGRTLSQADAIALAMSTAQPDPGPAPAVTAPAAGPLSARERQIMALLAGGASNAKIAETLFVTPNTVRTHLDRIRDKTGARNRAELTRYAMQAGIEPVVLSP